MGDKSVVDVLGRDSIIHGLKDVIFMLSENREGKVFALDGKWGYGKSYILDILEKDLLVEQSEQTGSSRYYVFNYNCWKYDYYDEPAIAIVSAMLESINRQLDAQIQGVLKDSWKCAKTIIGNVAGEFVEKNIGVNPVEIYKDIKENGDSRKASTYEFDSMFAFKKTLDDTRGQIQKLASEQTVVLIVDELDRCMPQYAIKVLERLHHIFDNLDNVVVLLAIDSSQLEHSVREIYGEDVDTDRYLKKFINFSIALDKGQIRDTFSEKYSFYFDRFDHTDEAIEMIKEVISLCNLDIRNLEKIIEKIDLIHRIVCSETVNSAVCVFEVMWTVLRFKIIEADNVEENNGLKLRNYLSLYWICNLSKVGYSNIDRCLSSSMLDFLKDSYIISTKKTAAITNDGEFKEVIDMVSGLTWYLFDQVCSKHKHLIYNGEEGTEVLVKLCRQFCERTLVLW